MLRWTSLLSLTTQRGKAMMIQGEEAYDGFVMRDGQEVANVVTYILGKYKYAVTTRDAKAAANLQHDISRLYVEMCTGEKEFYEELAELLEEMLRNLEKIAA